MKARKLMVCLMAAMLVVMSVVPAFAASSEVYITIEATTVNVTVPGGGDSGEDTDGDGTPDSGQGTGAGALPIVFKADGSNTYPTNWTITNNSEIASVTLTKIAMNGNGWKLLPASADTTLLAADTKEIKFFMGKQGGTLEQVVPTGTTANAAGAVTLATPIEIAAKGSQVFGFKVERAAFSQAAAASKAFDMTLTFEF